MGEHPPARTRVTEGERLDLCIIFCQTGEVSDNFLKDFNHLLQIWARRGDLAPDAALELAVLARQNHHLGNLIYRPKRRSTFERAPTKMSARPARARRTVGTKHVTTCWCGQPWPHVTRFHWSRHGYRMVSMRGTYARQRMLKDRDPEGWGEKFRAMGIAAMARKYTARRVAIFREEAPRVFERLGQAYVEHMIAERKRLLIYDKVDLFRNWVIRKYRGRTFDPRGARWYHGHYHRLGDDKRLDATRRA